MKFTNINAYDALARMNNLSETGKLGYAIAKNRRKIQDETLEYVQPRDDIVMKYSVRGEDGKIIIPPENAEKYIAELTALNEELGGIECDVQIMTVSEDVFTSGNLTSDDMFALDWMVSE